MCTIKLGIKRGDDSLGGGGIKRGSEKAFYFNILIFYFDVIRRHYC